MPVLRPLEATQSQDLLGTWAAANSPCPGSPRISRFRFVDALGCRFAERVTRGLDRGGRHTWCTRQ